MAHVCVVLLYTGSLASGWFAPRGCRVIDSLPIVVFSILGWARGSAHVGEKANIWYFYFRLDR